MGRHLALLLGLALACGAASPAPQDDAVPAVHVDGMRDPEMRSYRAIVAGLDAFDENHQMAPAAPGVRFRVVMRGGGEIGEPASGLRLRIADDDDSYPVPVGADGTFAVPRIQAAWDGNADLIANRKRESFKIEPEVRTPGLPENARRLGDLRLECRVRVAIVKEEIPFWVKAMVNTILMTGDWCSNLGRKYGDYNARAGAPLAAARLRYGDREVPLKVSGSGYAAPVADATWPDDATIELRFGGQ